MLKEKYPEDEQEAEAANLDSMSGNFQENNLKRNKQMKQVSRGQEE